MGTSAVVVGALADAELSRLLAMSGGNTAIAQRALDDERSRGLPEGAKLGEYFVDDDGVGHLFVNEPGTGNIVDAVAVPTPVAGDPSQGAIANSDSDWQLDDSGLFWRSGNEVRPWKPVEQMSRAEVLAYNLAAGILSAKDSNDLNPVQPAGINGPTTPTQIGLEALDILKTASVNPYAPPVPSGPDAPGPSSLGISAVSGGNAIPMNKPVLIAPAVLGGNTDVRIDLPDAPVSPASPVIANGSTFGAALTSRPWLGVVLGGVVALLLLGRRK